MKKKRKLSNKKRPVIYLILDFGAEEHIQKMEMELTYQVCF